MNIKTVTLLSVLLDQASKYLVIRYCRLNESITVINDFLYISYIRNPGAAFGFLATARAWIRVPFFIAITLIAGLVVYSYQRFLPPEKKWSRFALGLVWGGALGNFIDRILHYQVIDFIDTRYHHFQWYVFNVADSCITVGLAILFLCHWFEKSPDARQGAPEGN